MGSWYRWGLCNRAADLGPSRLVAIPAEGWREGSSMFIIKPHKHKWFFIAKGKGSMLVTKSTSSPVNPYTARNESRLMWGGDGVNTAKIWYRILNVEPVLV